MIASSRLEAPPFQSGRLLLFAAATAAAIAAAHLIVSQRVYMTLAVSFIMIAIWHGAFDRVLAEVLGPAWGARWIPRFYLSYIVGIGIVIILWWAVPAVALSLFLLYSALHFGTEGSSRMSPRHIVAGMASGFIPIAAACHWWPMEVMAVFEQMLGREASLASGIRWLAGLALWPAVIVALIAAWNGRGRGAEWLALFTTELMLFRFCSPIPAFAVFFCLWHTPEHMVSTSLDHAGRFDVHLLFLHLRRSTMPWLISVGAIAICFWFGRHTITAYLGVLFIALSALTVPHMALADLIGRSGSVPGSHQTPPVDSAALVR